MGGYELPTNLQNLTQKDLTEVKIFQKVLGGEGGGIKTHEEWLRFNMLWLNKYKARSKYKFL